MIVLTIGATLIGLVAVVVVGTIGLVVTTRYPDALDPRRNLKRYTLPAAIAVLILVLAVLVAVVGVGLLLAGVR